jgi:hypothetical protein
MVLDAVLAYFHFVAIFMMFAYLVAESMIIKRPLDATAILRHRQDRFDLRRHGGGGARHRVPAPRLRSEGRGLLPQRSGRST